MSWKDLLKGAATSVAETVVNEAEKRQGYYNQSYDRYSDWDKEQLASEYKRFQSGYSSSNNARDVMRRKAFVDVAVEKGYVKKREE